MPVLDLWLQHGFAETVFAGLTSNARSSWRRRFGSSTCISRGRGPSQCPIQNRPRLKPSDRLQPLRFRSRRRFQRTCSRFVRWTWDWTRSPGDFKLCSVLRERQCRNEKRHHLHKFADSKISCQFVTIMSQIGRQGITQLSLNGFFHLWLFLRH